MPDSGNLLLAALAANDLETLKPHLKQVELRQTQVLFEPGDIVENVYFPISGAVSLVVTLARGETVETAMVGNDGVIAASAALDGAISSVRAIVQLSGSSLICKASTLRAAAMQSSRLLSVLIRHEQTLLAQVQQSAACLAAHNTEARLCRWLLRARDLSGSDTLNFTQEFLAEMLGVQRASVTVVAHTLQQAGMIRYARGKIQILNRDAMLETTCECYEATRSQYALLKRPSDAP